MEERNQASVERNTEETLIGVLENFIWHQQMVLDAQGLNTEYIFT